MKDERNAEAGIYPFEDCCEHAFRVHSSKMCQISGCSCKRRRQLPAPVVLQNGPVGPAAPTLIEHLQEGGWKLSHEVLQGPGTTMVITRIHKPDGTILDESAWTP